MATKPKSTSTKKETSAKKAAPKSDAVKSESKAGKDHLVLETTKGKVVIKFRPDLAPRSEEHTSELQSH